MASSFVISDKELYACGSNWFRQLRLDDNKEINNLTRVPFSTQLLQVSCGLNVTVVLSSEGDLYILGCSNNNQSVLGNRIKTPCLTRIQSSTHFLQVSCSNLHIIALDVAGNLWGCRMNAHAILNPQYLHLTVTLTRASFSEQFLQIASSGSHILALTTHGELYRAIYVSTSNLLDIDSTNPLGKLSLVKSSTILKQVACGNVYTIALDVDGNLWGCGANESGQLGLEFYSTDELTRVPSSTQFLQVSCGANHTIALDVDGNLWGCGANESGQLGLGFYSIKVNSLTRVPSSTQFLQVSCSIIHTISLDVDGNLWGCGANKSYQISSSAADRMNTLTLMRSFDVDSNPTLMNCYIPPKKRQIKSALSIISTE